MVRYIYRTISETRTNLEDITEELVTKKHFDRIAEAFRKTNPYSFTMNHYAEAGAFVVWHAMMDEFSSLCKEFNPNFDEARFEEACNEPYLSPIWEV